MNTRPHEFLTVTDLANEAEALGKRPSVILDRLLCALKDEPRVYLQRTA